MRVPLVASYCSTFLNPETHHIYRQVTNLRKYQTFIVTKKRMCADVFAFNDIEYISRRHLNAQVSNILTRRDAKLLHIYFGSAALELLPCILGASVPTLVSFHGADVSQRPDIRNHGRRMAELLQQIPFVLVRSRSLGERIKSMGCSDEKIRLNYTGIPLDQFPASIRQPPSDGNWRFIQACRLIPKKGIVTALRAFTQFHTKFPAARLVIAGVGPLRSTIERTLSELNIEAAVDLPGFLNQQRLLAFLHDSHAFIHPSQTTANHDQEGIPNSMLEAMATGLPVLATQHGGIPEAVYHNKSGFLVAENDHVTLAEAMIRLAETPGLLQTMSECAAQSVRENFEQSKQIKRLEACYDEALQLTYRPPVSTLGL